jgi:hypothetical protein
MNVHESIAEVKGKMLTALDGWTAEMVDLMGEKMPAVRGMKVYLQRGVHNMLHEKADEVEDMLETVAQFVVDENGNYDMGKFVDDVVQMITDTPEMPYELGILKGTVGGGKVRIVIPDNFITRIMFGDTGAICVTMDDVRRMKRWFG